MKKSSGFYTMCAVSALCASAALILLAAERQAPEEAARLAVSGPEGLREELRRAQRQALPNAGALVFVDAGELIYTGQEDGALIDRLLPFGNTDGAPLWPVTLLEDRLRRGVGSPSLESRDRRLLSASPNTSPCSRLRHG